MVRRSSGIASYPVRYGRSAPVESSSTSTPDARACAAAARSIRERYRLTRRHDDGAGAWVGGLHGPLGVVARAHERAGLDVARTRGSSAYAPSSANSSGVHHRATGRCRGDGRRYWPRVRIVDAHVAQVGDRAAHLVGGLAHAQDDPRLRDQSARPRRREQRERAGVGRRRPRRALQAGHRLEVVVQHVGPGVRRSRRAPPAIALAVGDQHLDLRVAAHAARTAAIVAANPAAPPSARSSRATLVITACSSPSVHDRVGHARRARRGRAGAACGCRRGRTRTPGCTGRPGS